MNPSQDTRLNKKHAKIATQISWVTQIEGVLFFSNRPKSIFLHPSSTEIKPGRLSRVDKDQLIQEEGIL